MTKENENKIITFLEENKTATVDILVEKLSLARKKVKLGVYQLRFKKKINVDNDVITLVSTVNTSTPEQLEENSEQPSEDISQSSAVQVSNPEEVQEEFTEEKVELPEPETQQHGLTARIKNIDEKLDIVLNSKQKKEKKSKLKKFGLLKLKRFNRKQSRAVILLTRNQNGRLVKGEMIHGMVRVPTETGDNYYDGAAIYTWLWEGKQPCYIIPEWSIRPLAASEIYEKNLKAGTLIDSQQITLRAMKNIELDAEDGDRKKKPMNLMTMIGIVIVGLIVVWLFFGGKK